MSKRKYNYVVENVDQLESMKFCPYCGSDTMYIYLGDWHNYTVCLECEEELEFMTVIKELEE